MKKKIINSLLGIAFMLSIVPVLLLFIIGESISWIFGDNKLSYVLVYPATYLASYILMDSSDIAERDDSRDHKTK